MELAFLNGILRSETFPPLDPWLSGFAISYYYFGFVMMSVITQLTGTVSGVAFNLTGAMWFALTVSSSYGLLYDLISARRERPSPGPALLGPLFVAVAGNLEGFLEVLHARHIGSWSQLSDGSWYSPFWSWLDILQLNEPPAETVRWIASRHWWWWRASRVLHDVNLSGLHVEIIDEFPAFSFLLADNHPHVLALPFVLLAMGLALHVYLGGIRGSTRLKPRLSEPWLVRIMIGEAVLAGFVIAIAGSQTGAPLVQSLASGVRSAVPLIVVLAGSGAFLFLIAGRLPTLLPLHTVIAAGWVFGSLAFLNATDFPIYMSVFGVVLFLVAGRETVRARLGEAVATGLLVLLTGLVAFIAWYPTFASQVGGVLPNLAFPTKIQHTLVMWGVALIPIGGWLIGKLKAGWEAHEWKWLLGVGVGFPLALFLVSWIAAGGIGLVLSGSGSLDEVLGAMGASSAQAAVSGSLVRRVSHSWTAVLLGLVIAACVVLILRQRKPAAEAIKDQIDVNGEKVGPQIGSAGQRPLWQFLLPLVLVGGLLIIGPEFLYLRDLFGSRMNTVFKFYFGAWVLWGVAGAYALVELWPTEWNLQQAPRALAALPLVLGLFYPVLGTLTRTQGFSPSAPITLDGTAYLDQSMPGDAAAIDWLNAVADKGPLVEAVGPQYSSGGRISTHTGLASVLGWVGHEHQWRGSFEPMGEREVDIRTLYQTRTPGEAQAIVKKYGIRFVYVGDLERQTYGQISERKFEGFMELVYEKDGVLIYALTEGAPSGLVRR